MPAELNPRDVEKLAFVGVARRALPAAPPQDDPSEAAPADAVDLLPQPGSPLGTTRRDLPARLGRTRATTAVTAAPARQTSDDGGGLKLLLALLGGSDNAILQNPAAHVSAATVPASAPSTSPDDAIAMRANLAQSMFAVSGAGIRIGILSDSFDLLGGYASDVADGDLPAGVQILEEGAPGGLDEGRAMAELVHQVAPGASIVFHTGTSGEADFAAGILALQAAGCQIIVDDVSYFDEPFFQQGGAVDQAVQQVITQGVSYFTAASNEGSDFYQAAWTPVRTALPGLPGNFRAENFGTAAAPSAFVALSVPLNGSCAIDLQWDQPFASISGGAGAANSLAMALYTAGGTLVATSGSLQVGGDADQVLTFENDAGTSDLKLAIFANGLTAPSLFKFIVYGNATIDSAAAGIGSGSVTGHELVAGVNTVGAIDYANTPAFGGSGGMEAFSSVGSGETLFGANGQRLANPIDDNKVNFLAPDGGGTSVFQPFFGTSAAAPNAAAVAALMLQADPALTPAQVSEILAQSATPVDAPAGAAGAGLIDAQAAVQMALTLAGHV